MELEANRLGSSHLGVAEVEVDGFGMSDVKDSIRLRGEPSHHLWGARTRELPVFACRTIKANPNDTCTCTHTNQFITVGYRIFCRKDDYGCPLIFLS